MRDLSKVFTVRISTTQKKTLDKMRNRNIRVGDFVRDAIREKIRRDKSYLKPMKNDDTITKG